MRLIGIYADSLDEARPFIATLDPIMYAQEDMRALVEPTEQAPLAVFSQGNPYPEIHCDRAANGNITLLDGVLFNPDGLRSARASVAAALGHAIEEDGLSALARADAAAMICHFDAATETLTLARDPIGNVPSFYMDNDDAFLWASDLPSLLPFVRSPEIHPAALDFFMSNGYVPAPWSMVRGIHRVPPGHAIIKQKGTAARTQAYWRPSGTPPLALSEDEIVARFEELFPKAVARRVSDIKKTGVLLSAGVDSKTVLAAAKNHFGSAPQSVTFHYVGHDGHLNEASEAKACAEHFGSRHHVVPFEPADLPAMLPKMVSDFGEPFSYGLHTAVLSAVRDVGIRDLLCGTGADGWFAGFQELSARRYISQNPALKWALRTGTRITRQTENALHALGYDGGVPIAGEYARRFHIGIWTAQTGFPFYLAEYIAPYWLRRRLYLNPELADWGRREKRMLRDAVRADLEDESLIARGKILSTRFYGADMMQNWNHWSARASGTAIHTPYYDLELMDLIARLPLDRSGKPELRKYAATMMPHDMAYTKKIAQSVPLTDWFSGPLKEFVGDYLAGEAVRAGGVFDSAMALKTWHRKPPHVENIDWALWNIIAVSEWQKVFGVSAPRAT